MNFNPLPPQGKTQTAPLTVIQTAVFQSTSPTGEDTSELHNDDWLLNISIHFPHRGRHNLVYISMSSGSIFQSTSPTGEDTIDTLPYNALFVFQSTSPTGEDTSYQRETFPCNKYFNPLPPQGKTHAFHGKRAFHGNFNPLPPQGKTPLIRIFSYIIRGFQSTSPTGEDTPVQ